MSPTPEQLQAYKIICIHSTYFGALESYNRQQKFEMNFRDIYPIPTINESVSVITNLGNTLTVKLLPHFSSSDQVVGYTFDKKEKVFIVHKGSKRPKIKRETFSWDTKSWYDTNHKSIYDVYGKKIKEWNDAKYQSVALSCYAELKSVIPDLDDYLSLTIENAKETLQAKGWQISDRIDFSRFSPGTWLDHPETGYRCSAGVNNIMNFDEKTITQEGWSSDD